MRRELSIAEVAARRNRLIKTRQLYELGLSSATISRWTARGRLRIVHRGVYLYGGGELTPDGVFDAAAQAIGDDAVVGHFAAAALSEFWRGCTTPVDIVVPRRVRSRPGIRVHAVAELPRQAITVVRGIPVTSPERTILDLATVMYSERAFRRLIHEAQAQNQTDVDKLARAIESAPRHPGAKRVADEIAYGAAPTRSGNEDDLIEILRSDPDLPPYETLAHPPGTPAWVEVDVLFPDQRLVIEYDGDRWHSTKQRRESDARKQEIVELARYRVIRFTEEHLPPARTLARIRRELELSAVVLLERGRRGRNVA